MNADDCSLLKQRLPADKLDDLTPLTDVNWVAQQLEHIANSTELSTARPSPALPGPRFTLDGGGGGMGGRGAGVDESLSKMRLHDTQSTSELPMWEEEGRKLQVLHLPGQVAAQT